MFREPLAPTASGFNAEAYGGPVAGWRAGERPSRRTNSRLPCRPATPAPRAVLRTARRG
ncbi:MAG: hypothetical protein R2834_04280 [Rhodothermales bacterium]